MKIKINWGTGIVIAMVLFMIFILQFVYRVTFVDKYDHHLVSDDYYKDEILYQNEIDKENKALNLSEKVKIEPTANGLSIHFPSKFEEEKIEGTVFFQRLSNKNLDFTKVIKLNEHAMLITREQLVPGKWDIKIEWKYNDDEYLTKQSIFTN